MHYVIGLTTMLIGRFATVRFIRRFIYTNLAIAVFYCLMLAVSSDFEGEAEEDEDGQWSQITSRTKTILIWNGVDK